MKKLLLGTVGLVALAIATPASAADIAARPYTKAPPPMVAPIYDWTGFYIGLNGGGGWSHNCWDLINNGGTPIIPAASEGCHDATGGTFGGQIGYRWQTAGWVFGVEAQGNWADFKGNNSSLQFAGTANQSKIDAFGLFTGQIGYAWDNALLYVKGGAAVVSDKFRTFDIPSGLLIDTADDVRWGGSIGAGAEFGFAPNWTVGVEYDHIFLGTKDISFSATGNFGFVPGQFTAADRISQGVDLVTARVNYRWGGPVISKY